MKADSFAASQEGVLGSKTLVDLENTVKAGRLFEQPFYYLLVVAFTLFFAFPTLGFISLAYKYGFPADHDMAYYFFFVLVFYYIGFFILRRHADKIRLVSKELAKAVSAHAPKECSLRTSELNQIVICFQQLLDRLDEKDRMLEKRGEQVSLFGELVDAATEPKDLGPLLEFYLQKACRGTAAGRGGVLLLDDSRRHHFTVVSTYSVSGNGEWQVGSLVPFEETEAKVVVLQCRPVFLSAPIWQKQLAEMSEEPNRDHGIELLVPLVSGGEVIGVIYLGEKQDALPFSPADLDFILPLAMCLSYRYENLQLKGQITVHSGQFDCFSKLNRVCNLGLQEGKVFQLVINELRHLMSVKLAFLALLDEKQEQLELLEVAFEGTTHLHRGMRLPLRQALFDRVLKEDREIHQENVTETLHPLEARWFRDMGVHSCYLSRFHIQGINAGIFLVGSDSKEGFSRDQQIIFKHVGEYLGLVIHNNILLQQNNQCSRELQTLNMLGTIVSASAADPDKVLDQVGALVNQMIPVEAGAIYLRQKDTVLIKSTFGSLVHQIELPKLQPDEGVCGYVMSRGESVLVKDASQNPHVSSLVMGYGPSDTRSILCVPVMSGEEVLGAIHLWNKKDESFTNHDEKVMKTVAASLAATIASSRVQVLHGGLDVKEG